MALSGVSRAVVRFRSRQEFLNEVTRVLVESGKFEMTMISWHEPETQRLVPIARCGDKHGYGDCIRIFADEREEGLGPGGTAFRTGLPYVSNDFMNDPVSTPWRKAAQRSGWRGSAAIPIRMEGESKGILSVYSTEVRFFGEKELDLLQLVASEVAFGLEAIEKEDRRRQAEAELAASQEQRAIQASLVEASRDFIGIANLDGEVRYLNHAAKAMLGLEGSSPLSGLQIYDFFGSGAKEHFARVIEPAMHKEGWVRSETAFRHFRTGAAIPVELQVVTIRDEKGSPICLAAIAHDLTERREAEQNRAKLELKLAQAERMEALGRLTGGIAHDFNNLLTVILGYSELLAMSGRLNAEDAENVEAVCKAAEKSRDLVAQLMGFSRQQVISPRPLDLNSLLADSRKMLARLVGEDIEIDILPGEDLWKLMLDSTQVDQVLMNLAANARDAMPDGGRLTLETSNVSWDEAGARMNSIPVPGDYVLLTVSDTGSGMEAETAAHLFEPFFTTKERGKGTGLGLATVYGIVRQNHGFITVYTEPDHGTVFKLYFPRHMDASEVETKPETTEIRAVTNGQILLVEDDELVRNMIANELLSLGYKALAARSAEEAVEICGNPLTRIDLVITDVVMPKMKGTELRERLLEMRPGLRVLFMSGYTANVIVRQGVLKSGIHFLQKPFTLDDLQTKIQQILSENEPL